MGELFQRRMFLISCCTMGMIKLASSPLHAQNSDPFKVQKLQPIRVSERVYMVQGKAALAAPDNQGFISNAGFVITDKGVVVVDALGTPALANALMDAIAEITPQPIVYMIVSHYHADHIYGLQSFQDAGIPIIAHAAAKEYIYSQTAQLRLEETRITMSPWINESTKIVHANQWLEQPVYEMELGGIHFALHHVGPAHTPEDLLVYVKEEKLAFVGDLVYRGRIPFVGLADSSHWLRSLENLKKFDLEIFCPGHGHYSSEAKKDIELTASYLTFLRKSMSQAALDLIPFEEAYAAIDWKKFSDLPLFEQANRINAFNTYLLMEREVK